MTKSIDFRPVILAGGSGTRFWPRSRRAHAKQVLALDGERSMIQQTVERLKPLAGPEQTWVITNEYLAEEIADQLKGMPAGQIVQEPVARNTAPACGLAAFLIERQNPEAVLGLMTRQPAHRAGAQILPPCWSFEDCRFLDRDADARSALPVDGCGTSRSISNDADWVRSDSRVGGRL